MRPRLLAIVVTAIATMLTAIFVAAPASAEVGCWGDWCSGKLASKTRCDRDARVLATTSVYHRSITLGVTDVGGGYTGDLNLMYSQTCRTKWAELNLADGAEVFDIYAVQQGGYAQKFDVPGALDIAPAGVYTTPMIYSPSKKVQAMLRGGAFLQQSRYVTSLQ